MISRNTETEFAMTDDDRELHMVNRDELREGHNRPLVEVEVFTAPDATSHLANMTEALVADCQWVMRRGDDHASPEVRRLPVPIQAELLSRYVSRAEDAVLDARRECRSHVRMEVQQRSASARIAIALLLMLALGVMVGRGLYAQPDVDAPAFRTNDAPWWIDR